MAPPVSVPVDVIASVPDSAAVFSPVSSVPEVTTVASAAPEPVVVAPLDVMSSSSVLPALRRSSRVRSAYDCNAMPPLHSAVTLQACADSSSVRPRRPRDRRYRVRARRSSKVSRVSSLPLRADALSVSDLALLEPHLRATRNFWSATAPVQTSEELLYDDAMCLLAAASDDPVMACVSVHPVPSSELVPIPSVQCKEVPLRTALRSDGAQRLRVATATEVDKNFSLGAWGKVCSVDEAKKDSDAIIFRAIVLYKLKADGRETCRIAAQGSSVPDPPASETFSSVASDNAKLLVLSAMEAHCSSRDEPLIISDGDVVGGFLHIDLDSPVPLYLCFPPDFPHPLAGKCVRILHAIYGLKRANQLFSAEFTRVVESVGFRQSIVEKQVYIRSDPLDPGLKCVAAITVDDALMVSNSQELVDILLAALTARFGKLTFNAVTSVHTGLEISQPPGGGVLVVQDRAIARAASLIGVLHMPGVHVPVMKTFFDPPVDPAECVPVNPTVYSSLLGKLVQFLKTRFDVKPFVSELCSHNQTPLEYHYRQAIHILRYLVSSPGVGPLFKADSGVVLSVTTDAAFGLLSGGRSSGASLFTVGPNNAPFAVIAKALPTIALCPMTAEYLSAGVACQWISHFTQFLADLGWSSDSPVVFTLDNKTAISLVTAPQVSKKSLWLNVRHHFIRELYDQKVIVMDYVPSARMRANVLTKYLPCAAFLRERAVLFNCAG